MSAAVAAKKAAQADQDAEAEATAQAALDAATSARNAFYRTQPVPDGHGSTDIGYGRRFNDDGGALGTAIRRRRSVSTNRARLRQYTDPALTEESASILSPVQREEIQEITVPDHLYDLCIERINRLCGDTPPPGAAVFEAMTRYAGYLIDTGPDPAGPPGQAHTGNSAWFRSGAASVLAPYVPRRAV